MAFTFFYIVLLYGALFCVRSTWKRDGVTWIKVSPKPFTPISYFVFKQYTELHKVKYNKVELGIVITEVFCHIVSLAAIVDAAAFDRKYFFAPNFFIDMFWISPFGVAVIYRIICEIKNHLPRHQKK